MFGLPLLFPFFKFPLPLYALVESENVGQDTAGDGLNLMLGNIGIVDGLLSLAQRLSSVSRFTKAHSSSFRVLCRSLLLGSVDRLSLPCWKIMYRRNENLAFSHSSENIVSDFGGSVKQSLVEKVRPGKPDLGGVYGRNLRLLCDFSMAT